MAKYNIGDVIISNKGTLMQVMDIYDHTYKLYVIEHDVTYNDSIELIDKVSSPMPQAENEEV